MKTIGDQPLPKIYRRCGKDCYLDPVRKKLIFITPEETVRQRMISYLFCELKVPRDMIGVEEHLSHYGVTSKRRADIIVYQAVTEDGLISAVAVVECKAPGVLLGERTLNQVRDYADILKCGYAIVTDGTDMLFSKYVPGRNKYIPIRPINSYMEMLEGRYIPYLVKLPERTPLHKLARKLKEHLGKDIGADTDRRKAVPMLNFQECLQDVRHHMPAGQYTAFTLIEDMGVRQLSYSNPSGGKFDGRYRSFLIDNGRNAEIVSISVSLYYATERSRIEKTAINVAIDNEKDAHISLQLVVDDNAEVSGNVIRFFHHGRITVGNLRGGKMQELRRLVEEQYPRILSGNGYYLGEVANDRLWYMDDQGVVELVENLIAYALLRDAYRGIVRERAQG